MQCLKPAPHVVSRMIQGQALILHHQKDEIQQLNEVASLIWSCILKESYTVEDIVLEVTQEFETSTMQAKEDLAYFLAQLEQAKLVLPYKNLSEQ
jgi:hypothetical protein